MILQFIKFALDTEPTVVVPVWLLSLLVGLVVSLLTTWGVLQAAKARLEVKAKRNEEDIKDLQKEKVGQEQFRLIREQLNRMEQKLDDHIKESYESGTR